MAYYMLQAAYTSEGWAAQVKDPRNRLEVIRPVVEGLGGSIDDAWLSFGEYDIVAICQFPDNASAASFSIAASAGGAVKAVKTTPLMTLEEGIDALKKAGGAGYRPPGT
ncbi:MAG: GYD domain-containing protein [Dehalococcoidia bacterium]